MTLSPEDSLKKLGSAGKRYFRAELKIINSEGVEQRPRMEGEIIVKGPNVTQDIYSVKKKPLKKLRMVGFIQGISVMWMKMGSCMLLDRRADLIISGGENIYPAEIEGVLLSHHHVFDAGVIGVKDEIWGQVPQAFVVIERGSRLTEDELITFCEQKLAKYKIPKRIIFTDSLPRNAAKKLLRRNLRDQLERGNYHD